jgi:tetratricopeptide (TPR) repeat protein
MIASILKHILPRRFSDASPNNVAKATDAINEMNLLTMDGRAALRAGDSATALEKFQRLHGLIEQKFPSESAFIATSLVDLGRAYILAGQKNEARLSLEQALSLYKRIGIADQRLDWAETLLLRVCEIQGHFPAAEQVLRDRIKRLAALGTARDLDRASAQDWLGSILDNQGRFAEAIELLSDSRRIFETHTKADPADYAVCLAQLGYAHRDARDYQSAEECFRKALANSIARNGTNSAETAKALDNLAVTLGLRAQQVGNRQLAAEAIESAKRAHDIFVGTLGPDHIETTRCAENLKRLEIGLAEFQTAQARIPNGTTHRTSPAVPALPRVCFISHSYRDNTALAKLWGRLPSATEPVVFDPIEVTPAEFVNDQLVSSIMSCEGLIFIKGGQSAQSFWTVFERDLALRNRKKVFSYDPATDEIEPYEVQPCKLRLGFLAQVRLPRFQAEYLQTMEVGGYLMVFLSENAVSGEYPLHEVPHYAKRRLDTTLFIWLRPRADIRLSGDFSVLAELPPENVFEFDTRPTVAHFDNRRLDDLMVRLYWLVYRNNGLV